MDFHRRRLAAFEPLAVRDTELDNPLTTQTTSAPLVNPTVNPYDHGLGGVNQPVNLLFRDMMWWSLGILCLIIFSIRILEILWSKLRLLTTMSVTGEQQGYWRTTQPRWMPWLKKNVLYAALWKKRHNRQIQLSSALSIGTLPSRFHAILLGLYLLSNLVYMFVLNWSNQNKYAFCAELRGRSGTLAAVNMVPLVILAGRNNPLIPLLRISFDTYNLIHRWMGRVVVLEAVIHTIAWLIVQVADGGWSSVQKLLSTDNFHASGMVGVLALLILVILSLSPIRHAFYETFLNTHILLGFIILACVWVHCQSASIPGGLPQLPWIIAIVLLWFVERLARMIRLAYANWRSGSFTEAVVEPMPCEASRVTLHLPKYLDVQPGTHAYLRFFDVNPWESHPFSIAWVEHTPIENIILPVVEKEKERMISPSTENMRTSVSFVIGAQSGFTRKLYDQARLTGREAVHMRAAMEGPYAGHHSLDSYGHAVLIAGATGITHHLSYLRHFLDGVDAGTVATRRITLVWIVRDPEALEWVHPWMNTVMGMPHRRDLLHIQIFVTRPRNPRDIRSRSERMQMFPGRPNIPVLIQKEVGLQVGAMCVSVCGPGAMADDVRAAVNAVQPMGTVVDFIEESFTW